jgi:hypothetical protein
MITFSCFRGALIDCTVVRSLVFIFLHSPKKLMKSATQQKAHININKIITHKEDSFFFLEQQ